MKSESPGFCGKSRNRTSFGVPGRPDRKERKLSPSLQRQTLRKPNYFPTFTGVRRIFNFFPIVRPLLTGLPHLGFGSADVSGGFPDEKKFLCVHVRAPTKSLVILLSGSFVPEGTKSDLPGRVRRSQTDPVPDKVAGLIAASRGTRATLVGKLDVDEIIYSNLSFGNESESV